MSVDAKRTRAKIAASCAAIALPMVVAAQPAQRADSLLAAGELARAESAYYAGARARPRDPGARLALGRFLIARGATRVGATLLQESLQFGGDPVAVGRELVGAYLRMGDFAPLAALPAASPAQRARARWLAAHEPRVVAPDSVISVALARTDDPTSLGGIPIRVNGVALVAFVSPGSHGIVVSRASVGDRHPRLFAGGADTSAGAEILAVADTVNLGSLTLLNQPVTVAGLPAGQASIGLSDLGRFTPTADPAAAKLTLRVDASVHGELVGERLPTLDQSSGVSLLRAGAWVTAPADVTRLLRDRGWTFDARRGTLIVDR